MSDDTAPLPEKDGTAVEKPDPAAAPAEQVNSDTSVWKSKPPTWMWAVAGVVIVGLVLLVIGVATSGSRAAAPSDLHKGPAPEPTVVDGVAIPALAAGLGKPYVEGSDTAPVTVTIYEDLSCPNCRQLHEATDTILDSAVKAGNAKVERYVVSPLGEQSVLAANALACSAEQNVFGLFLGTVFLNQPQAGAAVGFTPERLVEMAELSHADSVDEFTQCLDELRYSEYVASVNAAGQESGLTSVPVVFVNGEALDLTTVTFDDFTALVNGANGAR